MNQTTYEVIERSRNALVLPQPLFIINYLNDADTYPHNTSSNRHYEYVPTKAY